MSTRTDRPSPRHRRSTQRGVVRIIGGRWRGRKLPVPSGVRPTGDRVRETLFNWLAPRVVGSRCLDLFAGSGALGFEALSRGAGLVCLVDKEQAIVNSLREQADRLGARGVRLECREAERFLEDDQAEFDIIFLDPSFDIDAAPVLLAAGRRLAAGGLIYLERPVGMAPDPPRGFTTWRKARAGDVQYALLLREN